MLLTAFSSSSSCCCSYCSCSSSPPSLADKNKLYFNRENKTDKDTKRNHKSLTRTQQNQEMRHVSIPPWQQNTLPRFECIFPFCRSKSIKIRFPLEKRNCYLLYMNSYKYFLIWTRNLIEAASLKRKSEKIPHEKTMCSVVLESLLISYLESSLPFSSCRSKSLSSLHDILPGSSSS